MKIRREMENPEEAMICEATIDSAEPQVTRHCMQLYHLPLPCFPVYFWMYANVYVEREYRV